MSRYEQLCMGCSWRGGEDELLGEETTISNGSKRLRGRCPNCYYHIKWLPTSEPSIDDRMPFGKHKDKTIKQIADEDYQYALWASANLESRRYRESFRISIQRNIK